MAPVKYSFINDIEIEHCIRCPFFVLDPYPSYNRGYCFHPQMPRQRNGERARFSVMDTNNFYFKKPSSCPLVEEDQNV